MTDYRESTGIGSSQTGAKGSDATMGTVTVSPGTVKPGGNITVEAEVWENIIFRGFGDEDGCSVANLGPGIKVEFAASVPELGRSNKDEQCIVVWSATSGSHEFSLDIPIPSSADEGEYDVNVVSRMANTGNVIGEETKTISVNDEGQGCLQPVFGRQKTKRSDSSKGR